MRSWIFLSLFMHTLAFGQCSYCTSLKEALKSPTEVRTLNLSAQELSTVSAELNQFIGLRVLDLSDNFIDSINFSELQLTLLEELDLSNNPGFNAYKLTDIAKAVPNLLLLDLSQNALHAISKDVGALSKLESLNLSQNFIRFLPQAISEMGSLKTLDVSHNNLENTSVHFMHMWNLQRLIVSGNEKLSHYQLGISLDYKDSLRYLQVDPKAEKRAFNSNYKDIKITHLYIDSGMVNTLHQSVTRNKHIRKVTFNQCDFKSIEVIVGWLNQFNDLDEVVFQGGTINDTITRLKGMKVLIFDGVALEGGIQFNRFNSKVDVRFINTARGQDLPQIQSIPNIKSEYFLGTDTNMRKNQVPPVVNLKPLTIAIDPTQGNKIQLPNSTYYLPPKCFVDETGRTYLGTVNLEIVEYFDATKMALGGVPVIYRKGNNDNLLATSGMIDFRAYGNDGAPLEIMLGSEARFEVNDVQPGKNTALFYFSDKDNVWVQEGNAIGTNRDELKRAIIDSLQRVDGGVDFLVRKIPVVINIDFKKSKYDPSTLHFSNRSRTLNESKGKKTGSYNLQDADVKHLSNYTWKMDTILTPEITELFKELARNQKKIEKGSENWHRWKARYNYSTRPRLVSKMEITPDLEHDNYQLTFRYKAELISFPVYPEFNGAIASIQQKEYSQYKKYAKAAKKSDALEAKIDAFASSMERNREVKLVQQQTEFIAANPELRNNELLMGVLKCGMVNCARLITGLNESQLTVQLDSIATDQNGIQILLPSTVRNILLTDNSYYTNAHRTILAIGLVANSKAFFVLNDSEIAVVTHYVQLEDGRNKATVLRINTKDKSSSEVHQMILNL